MVLQKAIAVLETSRVKLDLLDFSVLVPAAYPLKIVRIDPDTNEPIRNLSGYCEVVDYYEPGELIGKIIQNDLLREYTGYKDSQIRHKRKC